MLHYATVTEMECRFHLLMSHSCIFAATSQVREMKEKCTSVEKLQLFLWPPESVPTDSPSDCQNAQAHCKINIFIAWFCFLWMFISMNPFSLNYQHVS